MAADRLSYDVVGLGRRRSGPPRKYEAGGPVRDLHELDIAVNEGRMLWRGRSPRHARWIGNLPYGSLTHDLRHGRIRYARVRDEYRAWVRQEAVAVGVMNEPAEEVAHA